MKRPMIKDYEAISGKGAYDYVLDVNAYINYLESKLVTGTLICKGKCDHGYNDEFGNELFCSIKEIKS